MNRTPAHPGAKMRPLQYRALDDDLATRMRQVTGAQRVERAHHPAHPPQGYYRLSGSQLATPIFAKVITLDRLTREVRACDLANQAARAGLPALHSLGDAWALDDAHQVMCWPWVDGHFSSGSEAELTNLGRSLRELHEFLSTRHAPDWEVRGRASRVNTWHILEQLAQVADLDGSVMRALQWLLKRRARVEAELSEGAQPIHDDLHRGNVLFDAQGQVLAFLDFEEALDAWATPWLDLSWVTERFCAGPDLPSTQAKAVCFLNAYQCTGATQPKGVVNTRLGLLGLWRNLRALALLHRMEPRTTHWRQEREKFQLMLSRHMATVDHYQP